MKTHISTQKIALAAMASLFFLGTGRTLLAHDGDWDSNHHYYTDKHGYWDEHDKHQNFIVYKGHHGYWDTKGDKKVFITVKTW